LLFGEGALSSVDSCPQARYERRSPVLRVRDRARALCARDRPPPTLSWCGRGRGRTVRLAV